MPLIGHFLAAWHWALSLQLGPVLPGPMSMQGGQVDVSLIGHFLAKRWGRMQQTERVRQRVAALANNPLKQVRRLTGWVTSGLPQQTQG